jgi:hypothetical protein
MRKKLLAAVLLAVAGSTMAQQRGTECLDEAQQREMKDRMFNATLVGIFDLVPAQLEASRARAELKSTERIAASCEGFNCDAPRVALMQAQAKFDSAKVRSDTLHENLKVKLKADMESIRAEYPPCS